MVCSLQRHLQNEAITATTHYCFIQRVFYYQHVWMPNSRVVSHEMDILHEAYCERIAIHFTVVVMLWPSVLVTWFSTTSHEFSIYSSPMLSYLWYSIWLTGILSRKLHFTVYLWHTRPLKLIIRQCLAVPDDMFGSSRLCVVYYNMTVLILARNDINFTMAARLIRLHMPGVK